MFPPAGQPSPNPPDSMDARRQMMGNAILGMRQPPGGAMQAPGAGGGAGSEAAKKLITQKMGEVASAISEIVPVVEQSNPGLIPLLHMMVKVGLKISGMVEQPQGDSGGGEQAAGGAAMS